MKLYQIDSFTDKLFSGNPAGVCLLDGAWPSDDVLQNIAAEMNLSETAFVRRNPLEIRWFTPTVEVNLCGHATLAAAHALFVHEHVGLHTLEFQSRKGILSVTNQNELLTLDFPRDTVYPIPFTEELDCFNQKPTNVLRGTEEYMLVFDCQQHIEQMVCNFEKAAKIDLSGFIVTAPSSEDGIDFVSRYFAPKIGIPEDPVTGSTHTLLVPYWQSVTGKDAFVARQLSKRGGTLYCKAADDRIQIGGKAVTFFLGTLA